MSIVKDMSLAPSGRRKIGWVRDFMPALGGIEARFEKEKPFAGLRVAVSVHLEAKTANLGYVLAKGGAEVHLTGSNPLSTQDDVAAGLADLGVETFGVHGVSAEEYERLLIETIKFKPHLIVDDGGDLVHLLGGKCADLAENLFYYDNKYGTGQSVWDAIMHTTNLVVAGKTVVVAGYGWCGKGVAMRASGMGADVIVCEVDPFKALDATMNGFRVMPMDEAAKYGDVFVTVTGCKDVITPKHFEVMKNNAILTNAGHFDCEVDVAGLAEMAVRREVRRENIEGFTLPDGRVLNVIGEGRLVNLAAGNGHPAEIMDMSFAVQALALEWLVKHRDGLEKKLYQVPAEIDDQIGRVKLAAMGLSIDTLTPEQEAYLNGWKA